MMRRLTANQGQLPLHETIDPLHVLNLLIGFARAIEKRFRTKTPRRWPWLATLAALSVLSLLAAPVAQAQTADPTITITRGASSVTEGTAATFTVTADRMPTDNLTVNLNVSEASGSDFVASGDKGSKTVTITSGTTSATYSVTTQADSANEPNGSVTVTVASGTGYTVGLTSSASVTVNDDDDNNDPTGAVTINGTVTQNQELTAVTTTIADADGLGAFSYQWKRGGTDISGATSSTYTLVQADVGSKITVIVSYTDGGSTAESLTSAETAAVANVNDDPTGAVTINGTATQNQELTAVTTTIADADGLGTFSYQWKRGGTAISGATSSTYTLVQADVGLKITVTVSYTDDEGTAESLTSAETAAVANVNDDPTGAVTINGTATQNQELTAVTTTIADADGLGTFSYQWKRGGTAISGATSSTYTLVQADVGLKITVTVSYTDDEGTAESLTSAETAAVANVNDAPTVANAIPDQVVAVGAAFSYAFPANTFADVDSGDTLTYTAKKADDSALPSWLTFAATTRRFSGTPQATGTVSVKVTASDGTASISDTFDITVSLPTITIAAGTSPVTEGTAASFTVKASPAPAANLTVNLTVSDASDSDFVASGDEGSKTVAISGGSTAATYSVTTQGDSANEPNGTVTVTVKSGTGYNVGSTSSAGVTVNDNDDNNAPTGSVTISGTATQRQALTAVTSAVADIDGLGTFSYQWKRGGTAITGGTSSTYTLVQDDVGSKITVTASYTDKGGTAESLTSAETGAVANVNDSPTGSVTITGTATQKQTLTAGTTTIADIDGLGTFSYQWKRGGTAITGGTSSTYTLVQADVGLKITVTVSYTDDHDTDESLTSAETRAVVNVNDAPTFNNQPTTASVEENSDDGTSVKTVTATDVDDGDTITYSLDSASDAVFDIDSSSGAITVQVEEGSALNYEGTSSYTATVTATDRDGATGTHDVTISVRDVDEPPTVSAPTVTGASISSVNVSWTVTNTGPPVTYQVRYRNPKTPSRNPNIPDWINHNVTGTATSTTITNLGASETYLVQVKATNAEGTSGWSTTGEGETRSLTITISGGSAVTEGTAATFTVKASPAPAADLLVILSVSEAAGSDYVRAADQGHHVVTITASATTARYLVPTQDDSIDEPDGSVTVSLGHSIGYTVGSPSSASVTVNDNDATPASPPVFTDQATTASVAENSDDGTAVVTITATDANGDTITYSLDSTSDAVFAIDSSSGAITVQVDAGSALDHEATPSYTATVTATDGEGTASHRVTISVTDEDELPDAPAAPRVTAASSASLNVRWTAPANTGPDINDYDVRFRVSGATDWTGRDFTGAGTSTTISGLSSSTTYEVQVMAKNPEGDSDWSATGRGATASPNSAPIFTSPPTSLDVAENSSVGANVGTVAATDANAGDTLTYSLDSASDALFNIDSSGVITVESGATLDHEDTPSHTAVVTVSDGTVEVTHSLTINVTDVDEPPDAPAAPTVARASSSSVTVTWAAPDVTGKPDLTGYEVRYFKGGADPSDEADWIEPGEAGGHTHVGTGTETTITGLDAGGVYRVQVRASNDEGTSGWSASGGGTNAPAVSSVALVSTPAAGQNNTYKIGDVVRARVTFDVEVDVVGSPVLRLNLDAANPVRKDMTFDTGRSVTNTATLEFTYTVAEGDGSTGGIGFEANALSVGTNVSIRTTGTTVDAGLTHAAVGHDAAHKVDGVRPGVSSAAVAGATLTILFNEALSTGAAPGPGAFTVGGTDSNVQVTGVAFRSGDATRVDLTLNPAVVRADTGITLSYAKPSSNPLEDAAGNEVATFANRSVTNVTAVDNRAPVALAGADESVDPGAAVTLDGSASSDPDGGALSYAWVQVSGAAVTMTDADAARASFDAPVEPGALVFRLTVTDAGRMAASDTVTVTVRDLAASFGGIAIPALVLERDRRMRPVVLPPARGGNGAVVYGLTSRPGGLGGLEFDATSRRLSGTPTAAGDYVFVYRAGDTDGNFGASDMAVLSFAVTVETGDPRTAVVKTALKRTLEAVSRRVLSSALDQIGLRFAESLPATGLTLAGQPVVVGSFAPGDRSGRPCRSFDRDGFGRGADGCGGLFGPTRSRGVETGELLRSSGFSWTLDAAGGARGSGRPSPRWALWGRGDLAEFEGRPSGMRYDGEARTGWLGIDARAGRWVAGLAVSHGRGEAEYDSGDGEEMRGQVETTLTAFYPYGRWTFGDGLELRGVVGAGSGDARHLPEGGSGETSDLSMWMASLGLRQALPGPGGIELAARGDLSLARMETGSGPEYIDGLTADSWRGRAGLEASRRFALGGAVSLTPFVEVAARRDGGDGLTGTGLEVAGGVRYSASRLQVEARGRWLAAHSEEGARERGVSVTARMGPGADGRGLSFTLAPRWGAATSDAKALWSKEMPRPFRTSEVGAAIDARIGYGVALAPHGVLTPFAEAGVAGGESRQLRLGTRFEASRMGLGVEFSGERRDSGRAGVEHLLRLDFRRRF